MAAVANTKLRNFIGGEPVDPAEGRTEEGPNPAPAAPMLQGRSWQPWSVQAYRQTTWSSTP